MIGPELLAPRGLAGLAAALERATPDSRLIAGGTDLMLRMRASGGRPDVLINLSGLRKLSFIRRESGVIRIGALTTFAQIECNELLRRHAGCLVRAAAQVGSAQIRNIATIGGNVANASPCADAIPALLVLGAQAGVLDRGGKVVRHRLQDLLAEAGRTTLGCGEAIVDFTFAPLAGAERSAFGKIGARSSIAVAKLNAALVVRLDPGCQTITEARIAFGSIAPAAFVHEGVATLLCGQTLTPGGAEAFAQACSDMVNGLIPDRDSRPYKQQAVRGLADDLWHAIRAL